MSSSAYEGVDAGQVQPVEGDGGVALTTVRGSEDPVSPSAEEKAGPVQLVRLESLGVDAGPAGVAAVQTTEDGLRVVDLGGVISGLGDVPDALEATYDLGDPPAFGSKVMRILPLPAQIAALGTQLDLLALAASTDTPGKLYGASLVARPGGQEPAPGTVVPANDVQGYPTGAVALVEDRYLYVREDGSDFGPSDDVVRAYDLTDFTQGTGFAAVPSRTLSVAAEMGLEHAALAAMTPAPNPITGELAVAYGDALGFGDGAGILIFNPSTLQYTHTRLESPEPGHIKVDLTVLQWSADGDALWVGWDGYSPVTFQKFQSHLLVIPLVDGEVSSLEDANQANTGTDPLLRLALRAERPVTLAPLLAGENELAVVTSPYGGEAFLDLYRLIDGGVLHLAGASLGTLSADTPTVEQQMVDGRHVLVLGTARGILLFDVVRSGP